MLKSEYFECIEQESNTKLKDITIDYSINKQRLDTYYDIGKMIEEDIMNLIFDYYKGLESKFRKNIDEKINIPSIEKIHQFYLIIKNGIPFSYSLSWGHYKELIKLHDIDLIKYYYDIVVDENLSVRELHKLLQEEIFNDMD